jgi:hypothetical protein
LVGGVVAALVAGLAGLVAYAMHRRLHHVAFVPEPPSRSMDTAGWHAAAPREHARVLYVGHSLINQDMPAMTRSIALGFGLTWSHDVQLIDGGSLEVNWNEAERATGVVAREALASGDYDTLVLTEAVNLDDHLRWSDPVRHAGAFVDAAVQGRADIEVLFYETWHDRETPRAWDGIPLGGDWRSFLDSDLGKWEHIVDRVAEEDPERPSIAIIPGGQAMAALVDAIGHQEVPGVADDDALFRDAVHLSDLGNYFIALVQFATIARRTPVGATFEVVDGEGESYRVEPATGAALQEIAWSAVRRYPRSGVLRAP